ncbi:MAG: ABC transporter ATP-binding protein [Armatimonadota bacterium]|nr:ABC transporter ATP-binding protein [Armatimonadota bacterium]
MRGDPLLAVRGLATWYELRRWGFLHQGWVRAVDGVSFQLAEGEAVAVVGESGCGKSTLAKTLLGLVRPLGGEVWFEGRRLGGADDWRWYRRRVGYVQQDPYGALPPFMSVRRILEEPLVVNGVSSPSKRRARVVEALEAVQLVPPEEFLPRFPHMLSGGQQQRLVVARATLLGPRLLVADEPVSMLDASVRAEVLQLLRSLQQSHRLSVVYITHDLSTVRHFCERVLVMYAGKLVEQAQVTDLLREPKHPYTQALLAAIPDPDPENARRLRPVPPGEPPSLVRPPEGCRFHPRCPAAIPGVCDRREPPDFEVGAGHVAACWLYEGARTVTAAPAVEGGGSP